MDSFRELRRWRTSGHKQSVSLFHFMSATSSTTVNDNRVSGEVKRSMKTLLQLFRLAILQCVNKCCKGW